MNKQTIKEWAIDDRPREKLVANGSQSLSNSELLAILINNGTPNKSAVELSKELLASVNNDLKRLSKLSVKEIVNLKIKGLGPAKAVTIAAGLELGIRRAMAETKKEIIKSSKDVAEYLRMQFQHLKHEVFSVVFLNVAGKVNHTEIISEGGPSGTVADPRVIVRKALENDAASIVLCHNHPGGTLLPSKQDEQMTRNIFQAAALFNIKVVDHIIVSDEGYYSFADSGLL